jgi:aromatic-amino-acid transaminase
MRKGLAEQLTARVPGKDFSYVVEQRGMFSYSGLSKDAVAELRKTYSIYALDSGRICVAALRPSNLDYVATAIAEVINKAL